MLSRWEERGEKHSFPHHVIWIFELSFGGVGCEKCCSCRCQCQTSVYNLQQIEFAKNFVLGGNGNQLSKSFSLLRGIWFKLNFENKYDAKGFLQVNLIKIYSNLISSTPPQNEVLKSPTHPSNIYKLEESPPQKSKHHHDWSGFQLSPRWTRLNALTRSHTNPGRRRKLPPKGENSSRVLCYWCVDFSALLLKWSAAWPETA